MSDHSYMEKSNHAWAGAIITAIVVCAIQAFLAWSADRGLDVTDEGLYCLQAAHPEDVIISTTFYHFYGAILSKLVNGNLIAFRILGQALILMASFLCAAGFIRALKHWGNLVLDRSHQTYVIFMGMLGASLYYGIFLRTPSYNLLSSSALMFSFGFFLFAATSISTGFSRYLLYGLSGMFLACLTLNKFPSGTLLTCTYLVLIIFNPASSRAQKGATLLALVLGAALQLLFFGMALQSPSASAQSFEHGLEYIRLQQTSHNLGLFKRYGIQLISQLIVILRDLGPMLLVLLGYSIYLRRKAVSSKPAAMMVLCILATVLLGIFRDYHWGGVHLFMSMPNAFLSWLIALSALALVCFRDVRNAQVWAYFRSNFYFSLVLLVILAMPLISAFGTGNTIFLNAYFCMGPWFLLIALLVIALSRAAVTFWIMPLATLSIGTLCISQLYTCVRHSPYSMVPLQEQAVPVSFNGTRSLQVDAALADCVARTRHLAEQNGFQAGDDLLHFSGHPGLVFLMGGRSPGLQWYTGSESANTYAKIFEWTGKTRLRHSFFLMESSHQPDIEKGLSHVGLTLKTDYQNCGRVSYRIFCWKEYQTFEMNLWRPVQH